MITNKRKYALMSVFLMITIIFTSLPQIAFAEEVNLQQITIANEEQENIPGIEEISIQDNLIEINNPNEDMIPPELDVENLSISKNGSEIFIDYNFTEEGSGISNISFEFLDEQGENYFIDGNSDNTEKIPTGYRLKYNIRSFYEGKYTLDRISVYDNANNCKEYSDLSTYSFEILPPEDLLIPGLEEKSIQDNPIEINNPNEDIRPTELDVENLSISKKGQEIFIDYNFTEEGSGIRDIFFEFLDEQGGSYFIDGNSDNIEKTPTGYRLICNVWSFYKGKYILDKISVYDNENNCKEYSYLSKHSFEILPEDLLIPGLEEISIQGSPIEEGGEINIQFDWKGEPVNNFYLNFYDSEESRHIHIPIYKEDISEDGKVNHIYEISSYFQSGNYSLDQIEIGYVDGNYITYSGEVYDCTIEINNPNEDIIPPELDVEKLSISKNGQEIFIDFDFIEEGSGIRDITFEFLDEQGRGYFISRNSDNIEKTPTGYRLIHNVWSSYEGKYTLDRISVYDNANNWNEYSDLSTHSFEILLEDLLIPGLEEINIQGNPIEDGGEINIQFDWKGEPVKNFYLNFYDWEEHRNIYIYINKEDIREDGKVNYIHETSSYFQSGNYALDQIGVDYVDGNYITYSGEVYDCTIEINNPNEDIIPPELDVEKLSISKNGQEIFIDFDFIEEGSGIRDITFEFLDEQGRGYFIGGNNDNIEKTPTGYRLLYNIWTFYEGKYTLDRISIYDNANNWKEYSDLSTHSFEILAEDLLIPGLEEISIQGSPIEDGGEINIQFDWKGEPVKNFYLNFYDWEEHRNIYIYINKEDIREDGKVNYIHETSSYFQSGNYALDQIGVDYVDGNYITYSGEVYDCTIEINNPNEDITSPEIDLDSISLSKKDSHMIIEFDGIEEGSGLEYVSFWFVNEYGIEFPASAYKEDIEITEKGYRFKYNLCVDPNIHIGTYTLYAVNLGDSCGNYSYEDLENYPKKYPIEINADDLKLSELKDLNITGSPVVDGGEINVQFTWTGEPVNYIELTYINSINSNMIYIIVDGNEIDSKGNVDITQSISSHFPSGTYTLGSISVKYLDGTGAWYYPTGYNSIIMINNSKDNITLPPILVQDIKINKNDGKVIVDFNCNEEIKANYANLYFGYMDGDIIAVPISSNGIDQIDNHYRITIDIKSNFIEPGEYILYGLLIQDDGGNEKFFDADNCKVEITQDDFSTDTEIKNGWKMENGSWHYYNQGLMLKNSWQSDSKGWCYLDSNGKQTKGVFVSDTNGLCYIGEDGYWATTESWRYDNSAKKWAYIGQNGYTLKNVWVRDSKGLCYIGEDGYWVTTEGWIYDNSAKKWAYLSKTGYALKDAWTYDSKGLCYIGKDGYWVTTEGWRYDNSAKKWAYLDKTGHALKDAWVYDSKGLCYIGGDGHWVVSEGWKMNTTLKKWSYIGSRGYALKNQWVKDSHGWCYMDNNGYWMNFAGEAPDSIGICIISKDGYWTGQRK